MSERCLHNEVCKYGEKRSNGMYCTEEKCKQFKNTTTYVKECKNYVWNSFGDGCWVCTKHAKYGFRPNDYCSYGERKDND